MHVRSELTIEPFIEGEPGIHVTGAVEALRAAGFRPEIGPFGTSIQGPSATVHAAIYQATLTAYSNGATAVSCHSSLVANVDSQQAPADLIDAIAPILNRLGASLIPATDAGPDDLPLVWEGEVVAMVQPPQNTDEIAPLHEAVPRLIKQLEEELGNTLSEMSREEKQRAARWLDERGAFQLRNSVDLVADAMAVSRVTVYTYLSATKLSSRKR